MAGAVAGIKVANLVDEGVSGAVELTPSAPSDSAYEETPIIDTATSNYTARSVAKVTSEPEDDLRPSNKHQDSTLLNGTKTTLQTRANLIGRVLGKVFLLSRLVRVYLFLLSY